MSPEQLSGRVAVITGAAGAIGSAIAGALAGECAVVVLMDQSAEGLERVENTLRDLGVNAVGIVTDLRSEASIDAAAAGIRSRFGRCDVLVNNAGILPEARSIEALPSETWDLAFSVNLRGAFLCSRAFGAMMLEQRSGCIVHIGSAAATLPNSSAAYAISKAALVALSRQLAVEWGPRGIRSNVASPGFLLTPLSAPLYADASARSLRESTVPLRRLGTVADVANVVRFLASDAASYINAQEIVVDGGQSQSSLMLLQPQRQAYAQGRPW